MKQVSFLLFFIGASIFCYSQAGTPDSTFEGAGIVSTAITAITSGVIQGDGKIIVAGYGFPSNPSQFVVLRYNKDGSPDNSFGQSGTARLNIGLNCVPNDVVIQSDGKIIIMGDMRGDNKAATAIARINTDGSVDNTFANNGLLVLLYGIASNTGVFFGTHSIALQKNDQIVLGGPDYTVPGNPYLISRFKTNGSPDSSFGINGNKYIELNAGLTAFTTQLLTREDGKVILAGSTLPANTTIIARCNPDGSFDTNFNGTGKIYDGNIGLVRAGAIRVDGKFLLASEAGSAVSISQFNADGTTDRTFGEQGKVTTVYVATNSAIFITSLKVQIDNKIITSALYDHPSTGSTHAAGILRYKPNGTLDSSFAAKGKLLTGIPAGSGNVILSPANDRIYLLGGLVGTSGFVAAYKAAFEPACDNDVTPPLIKCAADIIFNNHSHYYTIPSPAISDNCGIKSTRYVMSGATTRSGFGNNASGELKPGTTYLQWTVTDLAGHTSTCTTIIAVKYFSHDDIDFRLFPNPTKNYFTVTVKSNDAKHKILTRVFNFCGKLIESRWIVAGSQVQMGSTYPVGIYYFFVSQAEQKKLIIGRKID